MIVGGKPINDESQDIVEEEIGNSPEEDRLVGDEQKSDDQAGEERQSGDDRIQGFTTDLDQSGDDRKI